MRQVIEWLRQQAVAQKEMAKAFYMTGDMPREYQMRARLADDHDCAADLLEALASPPGTVEELERRAGELWGLNVFAEEDRAIDDPSCWGVEVRTGHAEIYISDRPMPECIRAAWFAIVGMMEVERG